jgi:hypothetical protein
MGETEKVDDDATGGRWEWMLLLLVVGVLLQFDS